MSAYESFETDIIDQKYESLRDLKRLKKIFRNTNRTLEEFADIDPDEPLLTSSHPPFGSLAWND